MNSNSPLDDLINDPKKKEAVQSLLGNPNTKKLMEMLNKNAGGDLKKVATAAMRGDSSGLMNLMNQLMQDPEGAKTVQDLGDAMKK